MTREEALAELAEIKQNEDKEMAHIFADAVLCQLLSDLGYDDVVKAYHDISKWYA
jgi:hypothetical protein